jgi:uncharacterized membrane protein
MRVGYIDALRAMAIVWMVIFHTAYDMRLLGFLNWSFEEGFWFAFPRVIAFTFLFCVGLSLNLSHRPRIKWKSLNKRSLKLLVSSLIISLGTYFIFPQNWIFFGTLHCILVGSILGALSVNHRRVALILCLGIVTLQYGLGYDIKWVSSILQRPSMDFIPIYPWFWAILLGILVEPYLSKIRHLRDLPIPAPIQWMSTHSLKIYLIHQPVIFGTLWVIGHFNQ